MSVNYIPSKFNFYYHRTNGELLMYNSAVGTDSLIRVTPEKAEYILSIIKNGTDGDSADIQTLYKHGYIISPYTNEESLKRYRIMEQVMDNSLHLILLPTEQCNFRCKYCYETFKKGKMSETVQQSIIKYVRKNIHKYTGLYVSWFGGEPLIAMDVIERLSLAFQNICKVSRIPTDI